MIQQPDIIDELKIKDLRTVDFSVDGVGTIYFYEDRVFRGINQKYKEQVLEMFEGGLIGELMTNELIVDSWVAEVKIEGYELVIEHKNIPYWNYSYEWSFNMLKDAANTILEINKIANKYDFELFDVHSHNVVFDMGVPKYIDLGGFFRKDEANGKLWTGYLSFYNSFYMPLYLYSKGFSDLPQSIQLFHGYYNEKDFFKLRYGYFNLFSFGTLNLIYKINYNGRHLATARYHRVVERFGNHKFSKYILAFKKNFQSRYSLKKAYKLLGQIKESKFESYWQNYHDNLDPDSDERFQRITAIIKNELSDAESLVELASNQGKFAKYVLESTQVNKVIATDYDKNAVDDIYTSNRKSKEILPMVYDFVRLNGRINDRHIQTRISADIVMALAVTHHLLLSQDVSLGHIFKMLESHAKKYIIVEFMPLGLYDGNLEKTPPVPDYYTLEWFRSAFSDHFEYILDEEVKINRHLFVGKLKN